jgi:hypothetical protein
VNPVFLDSGLRRNDEVESRPFRNTL